MPSKATAGPKLLRSPLTSMAVSMCRLYGSAANTGRTQAVIPLLGPAGHPGGRDLPGAAYQRSAWVQQHCPAAGGGGAGDDLAVVADRGGVLDLIPGSGRDQVV